MKQFFVMITILMSIMLISLNCRDVGVQASDKTFTLTVDDASCTEVYLNLQIGTGVTSRTVTLKRDTITLFTKTIDAAETVVTDTNLLPNRTYTYTAQLLNSSLASTSTAQTMDTTSHNFTWQTYALGDGTGMGTLYDVAIIGNTAWAVGQIYRNDTAFNATKWDGQQWELKRITINYNGNFVTSMLNGIYVLSTNDIWLSSGVPIRGDGQTWVQFHLFDMGVLTQNDGSIYKICGSNSSNVFFVGNKGTIVHYDGSSWTKLESGTTTIINDIYGVWNKRSNQYEAYCAVTDFFQPKDKKILKITNTTAVDSISWNTGYDVFSVWSATGTFLYACGGRVFENSTGVWKETRLGYYTNCIRGSAANNVFVVGDLGLIAHFNGTTWQSFFPAQNIGSYNRVAVTNNMMIAVGMTTNGQAVAVIGRR